MMNLNKTDNYSQRMAWVMIEGWKTVVGAKQLEKVAFQARKITVEMGKPSSPLVGTTTAEIVAGQHILEGLFGPRGAIGIARRAGMAAFRPFLHAYAREAGFEELEFRLMPPRRKMLTGLRAMAGLLTREGFPPIHIRETERGIIWSMRLNQDDLKDNNRQSLCQFFIGLLQEYLGWISGGKFFVLDELTPVNGNEMVCAIRIDPRPLD